MALYVTKILKNGQTKNLLKLKLATYTLQKETNQNSSRTSNEELISFQIQPTNLQFSPVYEFSKLMKNPVDLLGLSNMLDHRIRI